MDGINITPQRLLEDLPQSRDAAWLLSAGRPASRSTSLFLHRDLNDHALRRPPAQSFSPVEMEQAKQKGFEAGLQAGLAAAAASREAAEAATLDMVAGLLVDARAASAAAADQAGAVLAQALVSAMGAIMPDLVRRSALGEAGAMLTQVFRAFRASLMCGLRSGPSLRTAWQTWSDAWHPNCQTASRSKALTGWRPARCWCAGQPVMRDGSRGRSGRR